MKRMERAAESCGVVYGPHMANVERNETQARSHGATSNFLQLRLAKTGMQKTLKSGSCRSCVDTEVTELPVGGCRTSSRHEETTLHLQTLKVHTTTYPSFARNCPGTCPGLDRRATRKLAIALPKQLASPTGKLRPKQPQLPPR